MKKLKRFSPRQPKRLKSRLRADIPDVPGSYLWLGAGHGRSPLVDVTERRGNLFVFIPNHEPKIEIKITDMIAGYFKKVG